MTAATSKGPAVFTEPVPYSAQRRTVGWSDAVLPFYLAAMALVAAFVPHRHWTRICRALAVVGGTLSGRHARRAARVESMLRGYRDDADAADIAWQQGAAHHEERLHCLQFYCGQRWRPDIRLEGLDQVEDALALGRGAILWIQPFAYSYLVTNIAFHQAGHAVSLLTRPGHGFTPSRLFARLYNPLWTRIENRSLRERIMIDGDRVGPAMATVTKRLEENKLVLIYVLPVARRTCRVPFLNGDVELPLGPVKLACRTGAPLLPVFTVRVNENEFATTVESPIEVPPSPTGEPEDILTPLKAYAALLESYVVRWPGLYRGW